MPTPDTFVNDVDSCLFRFTTSQAICTAKSALPSISTGETRCKAPARHAGPSLTSVSDFTPCDSRRSAPPSPILKTRSNSQHWSSSLQVTGPGYRWAVLRACTKLVHSLRPRFLSNAYHVPAELAAYHGRGVLPVGRPYTGLHFQFDDGMGMPAAAPPQPVAGPFHRMMPEVNATVGGVLPALDGWYPGHVQPPEGAVGGSRGNKRPRNS